MAASTLRVHGVTLRGSRVVLRPMLETDWDLLARWNSDPEVLWFSEGDDVRSRPLEEVQGIYRMVSHEGFCFVIEVNRHPIGECWLQRMNLERILCRYPGKDCRRIDLTIGEKDLWGQGYGTETITALTRFGFDRENADLIFGCGVADYNPRSQRAFLKAGFALDGQAENPPGAKARWEFDWVISREVYLRGKGPSRTIPSDR